MRPVLPYFVAYVVIGIALARWGGTDSSESNVSFAWEWFTMPLVVAFSYIVVVPFLALEWVQRRVRRNRRQPERATAPVLAPAAFRAKAKLWPQRRRWSAPEGTLVLNDECIAFESPGPRSPNYDCTGASRGARHSAGTSPSVSRVPGPSS